MLKPISSEIRKTVFFGFALCLFLLPPSAASAGEPIITAIKLNQQPKGDFIVILRDDGDFLVRSQDLSAMGLTRIPGEAIEVGGESFLSLRSTDELEFYFDEDSLTIEITAAPALLGRTALDLSPAERTGIYYPRDDSLFLNYGLEYDSSGDLFRNGSTTLTNEFGIRFQDFLFLTDSIYRDNADHSDFLRLNTRLIHDNRTSLRRITFGDFFATGGPLGSQVNLGGLSVSKIYDIDPYFINYPMFDFSGQLSLPSEVDVYLGGTKMRSESLGPGLFTLENFYGINGEQTVEIVIRDTFGRERTIRQPFYFTDRILRRGLHEYSYNLGLVRTDFGQSSNHYSALAAVAFHRYGFTDFFNFGWHGEAKHDLVNIGLESAFKLGHYGLLRLDASASSHEGAEGTAGLISYEYLSRNFRTQFGLQKFSRRYRTLGDTTADDPRIRDLSIRAGIGYSSPRLGSLSLDCSRIQYFEEEARDVISLSWSKRVWKRTYLNATFRRIWDESTANEAFLNLTYYFGSDYSGAVSYRHDEDDDIQAIEMRKLVPVGEGTGWELRGEHSENDVSDDYLLSGDVQYNAKHAVLRGNFSHGYQASNADEKVRVSVSGALVHLGGATSLTRPVNDSFGLVSVGQAENVEVFVNGQAIGRTNQHGRIIVPELNSYYENQVSFNDKDIPIEYLMPQVRMTVSPPLRSGSCLNFPLKKYQAFTGFLFIESSAGREPLAHAALKLATPGGTFPFWTGGEGGFYLDSQQTEFDMRASQGCDAVSNASAPLIQPGVYPLSIQIGDQNFSTELTVPDSPEIYVDMGEIVLRPSSDLLNIQTPPAGP